MSITENEITKKNFKKFYDSIYPYLNGAAHAGFTPVGTVISVMGKTAPQNYISCDGTIYNIKDYPELANYFAEQFETSNFFGGDGTETFAVPDLRGEFLRGTGTNSHANQGNGSDVGVHQDATEIPAIGLEGSEKKLVISRGVSNGKNFGSTNRDTMTGDTTDQKYESSVGTISTYPTSAQAFFTSRPTNTSVLYCIATKNIYVDARYDYSLEEKVVGTWIDSKPIYQKSIKYDLSTEAKPETTRHWFFWDILPSDIDVCFIDYGRSFIKSSNNRCDYASVNFQNDTDVYQYFRVYDGKIQGLTEGTSLYYGGCGVENCYILFTIQYTKTTD